MSVESDESIDITVDLDDGEITVERTVTESVTSGGLFNDGELRLWEDSFGWNGFEREEIDGEITFYRVNYAARTEEYATRREVSRGTVVAYIEEHIEDPEAGGAGRFRRRCSPP